ncbi:MAG: type V CRISPR-associated protein Cas12a/Cpf1 [Bacteroidota bacterium]
MRKFNEFVGLYPISKTLRFELKPIGKTLEYIQRNKLLEHDAVRADDYVKVKKIIDKYHKCLIDEALSGFTFETEADVRSNNSLSEYYLYYNLKKRNEQEQKTFKTIQNNLRKQIVNKLTQSEKYKRIDKKELITTDLPDFLTNESEKELVEKFKNFTTYFTEFHKNRKNMYSKEEKSTAIAFRLINENLPKFVDNISAFEKVASSPLAEKINALYEDFKEYLNVEEISRVFRLDYYNELLTQKQIDLYNAIVGGRTEEDNRIQIKGLNQYINEYNQQQTDRSNRLPKLKPLYKQILSDRESVSWLPPKFDSDKDLLIKIKECYDALSEREKVFDKLESILKSLSTYDLSKIYISNDSQLSYISQKMFGRWDIIIGKAIREDCAKRNPQKSRESLEKFAERIDKKLKAIDSISIGDVDECLAQLGETYVKRVEDYFAAMGESEIDDEQTDTTSFKKNIEGAYESVKELLNNADNITDNNLMQDKGNVEKIKTLLDAIKDLQRFIKPLLGKGDEADKDGVFYGEFTSLWTKLDQVTPLYNMVRNYLTSKPYSTKKIKLNFENSSLMKGWDLNKEPDNTTVIFRKDGLYYLGIMGKKYNRVFVDREDLPHDGECYDKMEYKLLPGANKMLPKVFFSETGIQRFRPSEELLGKYERGTHKKGAGFDLGDCRALIDFFKKSIERHDDWKKFDFKFSDTSTYQDISEFYREVEQQGYKMSFRKVSVDYIKSLVEEGKLYLFQIYNKDFSAHSKGTPNMHTLYWKMLFDEENLKDVVYKLNGEAEVFFRKSSITVQSPTHPANSPIKNKNKDNQKKESEFKYDLIKDRRYTVDKFLFHVPITMNFKSVGVSNINQLVKRHIRSATDLHIIGIDRGERHLLYLTVIDSRGNIKEQFSLNEIVNEYNGNTYRTDYHELLDTREGERTEARRNWQTIQNIRELKEGYLSQVIHKISELAIKYNAVIVLEDLNFGFMRSRQKVEKQVYQKFEKMLIDKLNYLVDKKKPVAETGGLLRAYQLTGEFESFKTLGKQSGILFYVPAWNTSKIDPVTGFVNLFDTHYENIEKAKGFFDKFKSIRYNSDKDWFEFVVDDYTRFSPKAEGTRRDWTICTQGKRIQIYRNHQRNNEWEGREIDLTKAFKEHFEAYGVDISKDLREQINTQNKKEFFEELLRLLRLTLQMRNSMPSSDIDYLISPVADDTGCFFDSRKQAELKENAVLPMNADANGAYNIARKGLLAIRKMKQEENDSAKISLAISNKEWLKFAQTKPYLED